MKNLPLGINALSTMQSQNMIYVDKTPIVWELVKKMGRYLLSRPRRFGKSLLVDTLKEIFEGNEALLKGLYRISDFELRIADLRKHRSCYKIRCLEMCCSWEF